jgi:hypothetical protein
LAATNSWRNTGITERAVAPSSSGVVGSSRQPRTTRFSSAASSSIRAIALVASSGSCGRKAIPVA